MYDRECTRNLVMLRRKCLQYPIKNHDMAHHLYKPRKPNVVLVLISTRTFGPAAGTRLLLVAISKALNNFCSPAFQVLRVISPLQPHLSGLVPAFGVCFILSFLSLFGTLFCCVYFNSNSLLVRTWVRCLQCPIMAHIITSSKSASSWTKDELARFDIHLSRI